MVPWPYQYETADKVRTLATYLVRAFDEERSFFDSYEHAFQALEKAMVEFRHEHAMKHVSQRMPG